MSMRQANPQELARLFAYYDKWLGAPAGYLQSIAEKETSYNPATGQYSGKASPVGAKGLMQLMPISLEEIRDKYRLTIDPLNPEQAVIGAAMLMAINRRYIEKTTKQKPGWLALAIAYNQGWTAGRRYMQTGQVDNNETRQYAAYMAQRHSLTA